ncbi:YcxB family protein [Flavobacterium sp. UW10123]|uniref:YcxB family protein n=1 Tax=Flavobacterium sp. UW10123 TaxID=3230800 RepID=UPI00339A4BD6
MTASNFSLELQLNISEIRKLNKMYFEHLFKEWFVYVLFIVALVLAAFEFVREADFFQWLISCLLTFVFLVVIQFFFADTISRAIFCLAKRFVKYKQFYNRYKLTFSYSDICVKSPLGELKHKWTKIEKVISTKNFLFLYVQEKNAYIISISKKDHNRQEIEELLSFVENHVMHIIKV